MPPPIVAGEGPVGTAHRTWPWMLDPSGRWQVLCQARRDTNHDGAVASRAALISPDAMRYDDLQPYLVVGGGEGVEINGALAQSVDGRWLVYRRETRVLLRDATDGSELDLSPHSVDVSDDGRELFPPGVASFAEDGSRMVYVRDERGVFETVVRELPGGAERVLDQAHGPLRRLWITPDGAWVVRSVEDPPSDGARAVGRSEFNFVPGPDCESARRARLGPARTDPRPSAPESVIVVPVAGGASSRVDDVLFTLGDDLVVHAGQALVQLRRDGRRAEIAPAWCQARVLARHPTRPVLLFACTRPGRSSTAPLQVYDERGRRPVGLRVASYGLPFEERLPPTHVAYVQVPGSPTDGHRSISLDTLRVVDPRDANRVIEAGSRYLERRGDRYAVRDSLDAARRVPVPRFPRGTSAREEFYYRHVLIGDYLVDLEGRVRGPVTATPLVVTPEGRALVPAGGDARTLTGPFVWETPPEVTDAAESRGPAP